MFVKRWACHINYNRDTGSGYESHFIKVPTSVRNNT